MNTVLLYYVFSVNKMMIEQRI